MFIFSMQTIMNLIKYEKSEYNTTTNIENTIKYSKYNYYNRLQPKGNRIMCAALGLVFSYFSEIRRLLSVNLYENVLTKC